MGGQRGKGGATSKTDWGIERHWMTTQITPTMEAAATVSVCRLDGDLGHTDPTAQIPNIDIPIRYVHYLAQEIYKISGCYMTNIS